MLIDYSDRVLANKKEFAKVKVGFLGTTGAGKTTIINALLRSQDLLPTTSGRAGTAVVVEISYNHKPGPEIYRAEVIYVTKKEWKVELQQLYHDILGDSTDDEDEDEGLNSEKANRIEQTFDKVKNVYPDLKILDDLKSVSLAQLLDNPYVTNKLGSITRIAKSRKSEFAAEIRSYVDSGNPESDIPTIWPLVKLVRVYTKATILEQGITLVDLPGSHDSNAARSAMAAAYLENLSVTCVVGNINRGIDERNVSLTSQVL